MFDRSTVLPKYRKALKRRGNTRHQQHLEAKQEFIDRYYQEGGKLCLEAIEQYGCNEQGEPLRMTQWFREYLQLAADPRIQLLSSTGASQVGKSLGQLLIACWLLTEGGINILWAYDRQASRDIQVPSNFRPIVRGWLQNKGVKPDPNDSQNNSLYQFRGATAQFPYTSTSSTGGKDGGAAAGSVVVGVSRDWLTVEEASQHKPGAIDPLKRRLDAGRLPSRPVRINGTKGSGQGIEVYIDSAQYDFHPHYQCASCGFVGALKAKGCLLKAVERMVNGRKEMKYFSESGRPVEWWHRDPMNAVESAYFGCSQCGHPIADDQRQNAWFQCTKTGVRVVDFLEGLPPGVPSDRISAAITLSPLLRIDATNIAASIIREGLESRNTSDFAQQRLAEVPESEQNSVSMEMLRRSIAAPSITTKPDLILAGIDQGRSEDWLMIVWYWLPKHWKVMTVPQVMESTQRMIVWGGGIDRKYIPDTLKRHGVTHGLMDNEPDIPDAARVCDRAKREFKITLEMADQKSLVPFDIKESTVRSGGEEYPCHFLRQEDFLKQVLLSFVLADQDGYPLYRLPKEWEKWVGNPSERSPLVHLQGPSYDPETGKWKRGAGNIDDLYYALMFAEACFYMRVCEGMTKTRSNWVRMV